MGLEKGMARAVELRHIAPYCGSRKRGIYEVDGAMVGCEE